jgi:hypothetical protein
VKTALDIAVVAFGVNGLASTAALVYVVRRVSPWPKPPAPAQVSSSRKRPPADVPAPDGQAPAANGTEPARSPA